MKKFLIFLGLILSFNCAFALEESDLKDFGIAKYAVLETTSDFSPLRYAKDENSGRFSHLKKNVTLYADCESEKFYRVDLGLGEHFWIEKKFAQVQAVIPQKRIQKLSEIKFDEDKNKIKIFIPMDIQNAYSFRENPDGLDFYLYDVKYSKTSTKIKNRHHAFKISSTNNVLNIKYTTPAIFGYDVLRLDDGLSVEINKIPKIKSKKPLSKIKVAIDAGHGGEETGVCAFGHKEKDVNLQISKRLKKALRKKGAKVYMTRKKDKFSGLYDRVTFAQQKEAQILISIHQNSLPNPKDVAEKHGVGVYYYNKQAKPLAQSIQESLLKQTGFRDDGVNYASFALTRPTNPVSVLVECGYLIDKNEMQKLTNKKFQKELAQALGEGVENYLRYLIVY